MTKSYHLTQEQVREIRDDLINTSIINSNTSALEDSTNIANAALDQVLGEQWQPIDTVPVNKSVLMLRMGKLGRCGMADGYKQENGVIAWPYVNKEPTHWMPLPSAPVNKLGG